MSLGCARPRNWGKDAQEASLALAMIRKKVHFEVRGDYLYISPHGLPLFTESFGRLENPSRGVWICTSIFDGHELCRGISKRDVVRSRIEMLQ